LKQSTQTVYKQIFPGRTIIVGQMNVYGQNGEWKIMPEKAVFTIESFDVMKEITDAGIEEYQNGEES
jgi:hypothetical protein